MHIQQTLCKVAHLKCHQVEWHTKYIVVVGVLVVVREIRCPGHGHRVDAGGRMVVVAALLTQVVVVVVIQLVVVTSSTRVAGSSHCRRR